MSAPVVKEGFLVKEGQIRKTWKKRYFVLRGGPTPVLSY